jgi:hypothetical protein
MRRRFYHRPADRDDFNPYPDDANPVRDRDVIVPLVILPRPEIVRRWTETARARADGWLSGDAASGHRGSVYGRTLIFQAGKSSEEPVAVPASPFETWIPSWDLYTEDAYRTFFLDLGKLVLTPVYQGPHGSLGDRSSALHLGNTDGAKSLGEVITVPAHLGNQRLRWASIQSGSETRHFLAYALLDGNGAKRERRYQKTVEGPISPYVRPLLCHQYQPKIKQHDELLLPAPLAWPPNKVEFDSVKRDHEPHEEWCLDEWFPAQKDACWVVREAADSKPLRESFLLGPANEKSDRPLFLIAVFIETEPQRLVSELSTLFQVSPDAVLNSPETMKRLNALYEKLCVFKFGK